MPILFILAVIAFITLVTGFDLYLDQQLKKWAKVL
jgi:hypothetical protein